MGIVSRYLQNQNQHHQQGYRQNHDISFQNQLDKIRIVVNRMIDEQYEQCINTKNHVLTIMSLEKRTSEIIEDKNVRLRGENRLMLWLIEFVRIYCM